MAMKLLSLTLAFALCACYGGKGAEPIQLIPGSVHAIAGVDLGALSRWKTYKDLRSHFSELGQVGAELEAFSACGLDIATLKLVAGSDAQGKVVVVVSGKSVGDRDKLTCLGEKRQSANHPAKVKTESGVTVIKLDGGKRSLFVISDDMIVLADRVHVAGVKKLAMHRAGAQTAVDGRLKEVYAGIEMQNPIWFGGLVSESLSGELPLGVGMSAFSGSVDLQSGLKLKFAATYPDAKSASMTAEDAKAMLSTGKSAIGFLGLEASTATKLGRVIDAISLEVVDKRVVGAVALSQTDLDIAVNTVVAKYGKGK